MKKIVSYIFFTLLLSAIACACSDDLDIRQNYPFQVSHLPVYKTIKKGETVEIRCQLIREGHYENTSYFVRYFQPDGKGELKLDDGRILVPNDEYILDKESFNIYYTSSSVDQEKIDITFFDSFGNSFDLSFTFNNAKDQKEESIFN